MVFQNLSSYLFNKKTSINLRSRYQEKISWGRSKYIIDGDGDGGPQIKFWPDQ